MEPPPVTVIIPVHNRPQMLEQALTSLRNQTFKEFEVVICDDASTVNLQPVLQNFPDLLIRYYRFDHSEGAQVNHQRGADLCTTPYAIFLHSDDILLPEALSDMVASLEAAPEAAACIGGLIEFHEESDKRFRFERAQLPLVPATSNGRGIDLNNISGICPSQTMLRMQPFREIGGFNLGCRIVYDWELFLALRARYAIAVLRKITTAYRLHADQATQQRDFDGGFFLNARDAFFVTSSKNALRHRVPIPPWQRVTFRQLIGLRLLGRLLRTGAPVSQLRKVLYVLVRERVLLGLPISAPIWLIVRLFKSPPPQPPSISATEKENCINAFFAAISQSKHEARTA